MNRVRGLCDSEAMFTVQGLGCSFRARALGYHLFGSLMGQVDTLEAGKGKGGNYPIGVKGWVLLGGSCVVLSGVISRATIIIKITHVRGLITLLITTHEPPSGVCM